MSFFTNFKALPQNTRRLLSLGIILALVVALPLFIWAIVNQKFLINKNAQEVQRIPVTITGAPYIGPVDAPVTIVEFGDFQCPYCKTFHDTTLQPLLAAYPNKIKFVFRNFPLTAIHPQAEIAAEAGACANEQGKFWQMSDLMFANQDNLMSDNLKTLAATVASDSAQFNSCLDTSKYSSVIQKDLTDGTSYGVTGTPTFFIDGLLLAGNQPLSAFTQIIDSELNPSPSPSPTGSPLVTPGPNTLTIPTDSFIDGTVGVDYRNFFYGEEATYSVEPQLTLTATNLPPGLSIPTALCGNSFPTDRGTVKRTECALNGVPTTAGNYVVHVTLSDNLGHTISKDVPITILAASPTVTPTATPNTSSDDIFFVPSQTIINFTTTNQNPNTSINPLNVVIGQTYTVDVNFQLQNTLKANYPDATSTAKLVINSHDISTTPISIPLIAAHTNGAGYSISGSFTATSTDTNLAVVFDPNNTYAETNENNNSLAYTFSTSPTPTATPTLTPTPTPTGTPNSCGGTCGSNYNCNGGLFCFNGFCRNPDCREDLSCGCATPTPTATAKVTAKPKSKVSPTPYSILVTKPTTTPYVLPSESPSANMSSVTQTFDYVTFGIWAVLALLALLLIYGLIKLFSGKDNPPEVPPTTTEPVEPMQTTTTQTTTENYTWTPPQNPDSPTTPTV